MTESPSNEGHGQGSTGNLKVAFLLNLSFTIVEIIAGLWTNSIAVVPMLCMMPEIARPWV